VAGLAVTLAQDPPPQAPTFRATAAAVMVDVTVLRNGRPLTGLSEADFEVLDNGVAQSVATISYGKLPIDVTVALDVSYSVTGALLDRLRRAVGQLMGDLAKGDRLKLMLFSSRVTRVVDFTTDVQAVERAIRATAAGGGTAVFDAISVALVSAAEPDRRQLVVFFTDGRDSTSTTSPAALHHTAERTTARLSIVVPGPSMSPLSATPAMRAALEAERARTAALWPIAAETGGGLVSFSGNMDLSSTFRRILDEFRSTYVLHYTPRGVERTGFHTLQVNVKRENVTVKARRGYFGG
jgi:VWFA-related protein